MIEGAKLLLSWICALQLEALALHITLINQSRADLSYAPCKMHQYQLHQYQLITQLCIFSSCIR